MAWANVLQLVNLLFRTEAVKASNAIRSLKRQAMTSGVKLINLSDGVTVASFAKVREKKEEKEEAQEESAETVTVEEQQNSTEE